MYTFSIYYGTLLAPCTVHLRVSKFLIEASIFTSSFLPCDLGLGETVSFAFDARVGALSECLIGGLQNPARRYCYRTTRLFEHPPGASTISAVNPGVSRIVILSFRHSYQKFQYLPIYTKLGWSSFRSRDGFLSFFFFFIKLRSRNIKPKITTISFVACWTKRDSLPQLRQHCENSTCGSSRWLCGWLLHEQKDRQIEENAFAALKELTALMHGTFVNSHYDTRARSVMLHRLKTDLRVVSSKKKRHAR